MLSLLPWGKRRSETEVLPTLWTEFDRWMDRFFGEPWPLWELGVYPRMNLEETDDAFLVRLEVPGLDPKHLEVSVQGDLITVRAEEKEKKEGEESYLRFQRTVRLPKAADPERVEAVCKNGILTLRVRKRPEAQAKKIPVTVR